MNQKKALSRRALLAPLPFVVVSGNAREQPAPPPRARNPVTLTVNGQTFHLDLDNRTTLLDVLREHIGLTGTKKGCDHGQCGALHCACERKAGISTPLSDTRFLAGGTTLVHLMKLNVETPLNIIDQSALERSDLHEVAQIGTAAAVANAIFHATGKRIRDLPIRLEKLL